MGGLQCSRKIFPSDTRVLKLSLFEETPLFAGAWTVPLAVTDPSSERGLRRLLPTHITEANAASHEGCATNLLTQIPLMRDMVERKQYPFVRLDVNIYFHYLKVYLMGRIHLIF